jgi:hypothetical protein
VQLGAPGESIYSTLRESKYGYLSGGSMASAQVSGAAALVLSARPGMSAEQVRSDIVENVDKIASLKEKVTTGGRLNVCKAMPGCMPPTNTSPPTITGTAQQERTLTEAHGQWTNEPLTGYAYQWLRCESSGGGCKEIPGATKQSYEAAFADVGHTLRVQESASNAGGTSAAATSEATAVVRQPLRAVARRVPAQAEHLPAAHPQARPAAAGRGRLRRCRGQPGLAARHLTAASDHAREPVRLV